MTYFVPDLLGKLWDEEVKRRDVGILGTEGESLRWGGMAEEGQAGIRSWGKRGRRPQGTMDSRKEESLHHIRMCSLQCLGRTTCSRVSPSSAETFWSHVSHWLALSGWQPSTGTNTLSDPITLLPGGLCTLAVLLALSPPRWACWGLPCALLEPRSTPADMSMCASDLQRAEVTQLAAPGVGETEQSCLCRFPISLFPQGSPPRLISMHKMDGSYQQNNTRATILLGEIPEAALCEL